MSLWQSLYLALPAKLQNIALDIKGTQERRIRFSGVYPEARRLAADQRGKSRSSTSQLALDRVNELLDLARRGTELYPRHWGGSVPTRLETLEQIEELPLLEKELLRESNDLVRCSLVPTPITLQTTGTTGTPIRIFCDDSARQRNYAFFDDFLASRGINPRGTRAVFGGRILLKPDLTGPYWRHSRSLNSHFYSSYHIGPRTVTDYVDSLMTLRPDYIEAYPSAISHLARLITEAGLRLDLKIPVITSSETLEDSQRNAIEDAFGDHVYDQYGAAEMCVFAEMCESGRYHVRQDYSFVEVLNEQGSPAKPGEVGQVVCTGFLNPGMPLIRYVIGDFVEVAPSTPCPCGWDTPTWAAILGRKDDVVWTRSGRAIGRLSPILKGFPISRAMYVQDDIDFLRVLVVPAPGFSSQTVGSIADAVQLRVGSELTVIVEPVQGLPTGPGGKQRNVVVTIARPGSMHQSAGH